MKKTALQQVVRMDTSIKISDHYRQNYVKMHKVIKM